MKTSLSILVLLVTCSLCSAAMMFEIEVNGQAWSGQGIIPSDVITVWLISDSDGAPFGGGGFADYTVEVTDGDYIDAVLSILPSTIDDRCGPI